MALVIKDRVQETATANTTVSFTLLGAVTGYQSFSTIGNTNTVYYASTDASGNWEVGTGTWATGGTLTRTTILSSSNAGSAVTFSGTVTVFGDYPATYATALGNASTGSGSVVLSTAPTFTTSIDGGATFTAFASPTTLNLGYSSTATSTTNIAISNPASGNTNNITIGALPASGGNNIISIGSQTFRTGDQTSVLAGDILNISSGNNITISALTNITIGSTTSTAGPITLGRSTGAATVNVATGVTASGNTAVVNIGTAGASGSTTAITLGSTVNTSTIALKAAITVTGSLTSTIGSVTPSTGSFTSLAATSRVVTGVLAKSAGLTAVTAVAGSLTLATGGVTLATQSMAASSVWKVRAYGTYAASSSANARSLTMSCFWGATALTSITAPVAVLVTTAQTTNWNVEFTITGSSTTAAWVVGQLSQNTGVILAAGGPALLTTGATPSSVSGLTTSSTLDFRVGQTGTATAGDTINVQSVIMERLV